MNTIARYFVNVRTGWKANNGSTGALTAWQRKIGAKARLYCAGIKVLDYIRLPFVPKRALLSIYHRNYGHDKYDDKPIFEARKLPLEEIRCRFSALRTTSPLDANTFLSELVRFCYSSKASEETARFFENIGEFVGDLASMIGEDDLYSVKCSSALLIGFIGRYSPEKTVSALPIMARELSSVFDIYSDGPHSTAYVTLGINIVQAFDLIAQTDSSLLKPFRYVLLKGASFWEDHIQYICQGLLRLIG